ncbi:serine hydrolase domain-containing protein [Candidatus Leptofilum sp.]|uniref:serine hydrolase domain-containing protein n=1 Tax=Candidatus Leptofilum sp. TaxID=3241576 RepID=UPI003B5B1C44
MIAERLARLERVMQGYIDRHELAGIVTLIAHHGQIAHSAQFGYMDLATKRPMQADTIFRVASMAKPITSVAAMMLFERGHFLLTDPISAYIPEFKDLPVFAGIKDGQPEWHKQTQEITFWHLLTHTSGLGYPESDNQNVAALYQAVKPNDSASLEDLAIKLAALPLFVQPGSQWQYGYSQDVLARLVELLSGCEFGDFLEKEIFQPLGMADTAYHVPQGKIARLASAYTMNESGRLEEIDPISAKHTLPPGLKPGGHGLFSTAQDYLRFAQMMFNGGQLDGVRLLNRKTIALMTTNNLPQNLLPIQIASTIQFPGSGYGLGFGIIMDPVAEKIPGSAGSFHWGGAYFSRFWVDPEEALIGIFMSQLLPSDHHKAPKQFRAMVYQALDDR